MVVIKHPNNEVVKRLLGKHCTFCDGDEFIIAFNTGTNRLEIQKCDNCNLFETDIDAWESMEPDGGRRKIGTQEGEIIYERQQNEI